MTRYAKSIIAFLTALGTWGVTAAPDGYSQIELWGLLGVLVAAAAVFQVPNTPPVGEPADPNISERGAVENMVVLIIAVFAFILGAICVKNGIFFD